VVFQEKSPTLVLMLDFSKVFNSLDWYGLRMVMCARGLPKVWCDWMDMVLALSCLAILLNGIPRPWIDFKIGLRQGGPPLPYMFLLVPHVLHMSALPSFAVLR
jgi:hypothetical protein